MLNAMQIASMMKREPKYVQVKDAIKHRILAKEWPADSQIPTESELCDIYGVSRITVRKALEELQIEGYLTKVQGRGTFVGKEQITQRLSKFYSFSEELKKRGMEEHASVLKLSIVKADEHKANRLGILPGEELWCISRLRCTEEMPYAIETSYTPFAMMPDLTREGINKNGLYKTMAASGVNVDSAIEHFMAVNLHKDQAKLLNVREDAAAIRLVRVAYSGSRAVEYCISIVRGDFFNYTVELT